MDTKTIPKLDLGMVDQLVDDILWCDHSMYHTWIICPRMFYWEYIRGQHPRGPRTALDFGSAWHRGQATLWACWDPVVAAADAISGFVEAPGDPRSHARLSFLLTRYLDKYPPTEQPYEMLLNENVFSLEIADGMVWRGRVDKVLQHKGNGNIVIMDHKTTSRFGSSFFEQFFPSWQFSGYLAGAEQLLRGGRVADDGIAPVVKGIDLLGSGALRPYVIIDVCIGTYANVENPILTKAGKPRANQKTWEDCFHRSMPPVMPPKVMWPQVIWVLQNEIKPAILTLGDPNDVTDDKLNRWAQMRPGPHSCNRYNGCPYREFCRNPRNIPDYLRSAFEFRAWDPAAVA